LIPVLKIPKETIKFKDILTRPMIFVFQRF
jgi:hypothetical protein